MINKLSVDLSTYRLNKAKDLLLQAKLLFENNKYDGSINRSYYAIFNLIRSLLALLELDSSKHSGVLSYFDKYFVKTQIFGKQYSKIAHSAFDIRQDSDYDDFYIVNKEEAQNQLKETEVFLNEIKIKLKQLIDKEIKLPEIDERKWK